VILRTVFFINELYLDLEMSGQEGVASTTTQDDTHSSSSSGLSLDHFTQQDMSEITQEISEALPPSSLVDALDKENEGWSYKNVAEVEE
jgi:hypothetical protein